MSSLGLLQPPCRTGFLDTLVVLVELPNGIPELFHFQLLPQVTSNLGQLQLLHRAGILDTLVLLAFLCNLKIPQVLQSLLHLVEFLGNLSKITPDLFQLLLLLLN